jgi:hypothetical protein
MTSLQCDIILLVHPIHAQGVGGGVSDAGRMLRPLTPPSDAYKEARFELQKICHFPFFFTRKLIHHIMRQVIFSLGLLALCQFGKSHHKGHL